MVASRLLRVHSTDISHKLWQNRLESQIGALGSGSLDHKEVPTMAEG